jgi:hypothetical protein
MVIAGPDDSYPIRCTFVFHLERDEWRSSTSTGRSVCRTRLFSGSACRWELLAAAVTHEQPDPSGAAAPDGTVTLVFTDIEE